MFSQSKLKALLLKAKLLMNTLPRSDKQLIPNEVVSYMIKEDMTPIGAWRKHLGLSQSEVAERIGITQPAYAQQEQATRPRKATREKIANALGIAPALLDL